MNKAPGLMPGALVLVGERSLRRQNEHYSLSSGNIMIPVAAIEMGTPTLDKFA